jgi:uncharacterized repeat protein (TIGR01451 family)
MLVQPVFAGVKGSAGPDYPALVNVGQTFAATFTLDNSSDGDDEVQNIDVYDILYTPSCGSTASPICSAGNADLGVFQINTPSTTPSGTIKGKTGTACAGRTFTVDTSTSPADPTVGSVLLIPDSSFYLGPANGSGDPKQCIIEFTLTVLKKPFKDSKPLVLGQQTSALGFAFYAEQEEPYNEGGGTGTDTATVTGPDVTVMKTTSTPTINAGESASYSITVGNSGDGTAKNVVLEDTLPDGSLTWSISGPDSGSCSIAAGKLTCNFGDMASGATKSITLTATTSSTNCPEINNTATVKADNELPSDRGNNSSGPIKINVKCIAPPVVVPTMTEWGMIIFMVLSGLGSVYYLRRSKREES